MKHRCTCLYKTGCSILLVGLCALFFATSAIAQSDQKALEIADRVMEALGGEQAWSDTRFIRFNFGGSRTHFWDKHTGRYRLEGRSRDSVSYCVLMNLNTKEGRVYLDGQPAEGEKKAEWLENAYGAWVNDTYWLLMPYKLRDPGVNLIYEGRETIAGTKYYKLKLTFDNVGLTPGDTYWAYINPETGLMDRWAYFLESYEPERTASHWSWSGWQKYGDIMLAPGRKHLESGRELPMNDIAVFDNLPDSVFTSAQPIEIENTN